MKHTIRLACLLAVPVMLAAAVAWDARRYAARGGLMIWEWQ